MNYLCITVRSPDPLSARLFPSLIIIIVIICTRFCPVDDLLNPRLRMNQRKETLQSVVKLHLCINVKL